MLLSLLFALGCITGAAIDFFLGSTLSKFKLDSHELQIHDDGDTESPFDWQQIKVQWKHCLPLRAILATGFILMLVVMVLGELHHNHASSDLAGLPLEHHPGVHAIDGAVSESAASQISFIPGYQKHPAWIHYSLIFVLCIGLLIVSVVSNHFLEEHLWHHVVVKHIPRIFFWVGTTMILIYGLNQVVSLQDLLQGHRWSLLVLACLIGLIPDSSPQLAFVTLFATGHIPFSILLANSVAQDGHGLIPMLAHSKPLFFIIKIFNAVIAFVIGGTLLAVSG
jgi:hypothetical protein